ncbi:MAG: SGNH/GDSL hydrolase family protein [Acutalibacteraceae bacterium]|nr:SGNH/GDSL hydrolase family protein [Acutalibacteraceae bacterium]
MENDISKLDSNFAVKKVIEKSGMNFYSIDDEPFSIYGVFKEKGCYRRMPESTARLVSDGVYSLSANAAGGRVRFKTDSEHISVIVKMNSIGRMPHFPLTGSAGLDFYVNCGREERYAGTFIPPLNITGGFEATAALPGKQMRVITIFLPTYSTVSDLLIGIDSGSRLEKADGYGISKPVVFYGSSITQGGCSSRPGNAYQSIISRRLSCDFINLGFSGNAKGEQMMADYIAGLDMSAFVYDYDHNAPTAEHLKKTHERMFKTVRQAHPETPVIILSRPKYYLTDDEKRRFEIIKATYDNAVSAGDANVYLIDGKTLMADAIDNGTVDNCHPNDWGFACMAKAVGDVLEKIL